MQRQPYRIGANIFIPGWVGHVFETHPLDGKCLSEYLCIICDGGLSNCIVCGLAEGALTTECPGVDCRHLSDTIYNDGYDFREGAWTTRRRKR